MVLVYFDALIGGVEVRDLWRLQKEVFARLEIVAFYEMGMGSTSTIYSIISLSL